uniref:Uncharacterized protein n=1 Tax=Panagrolaimus sp. ES5 TaxID=591445 RepID=A0AC34GLP2_9BILA
MDFNEKCSRLLNDKEYNQFGESDQCGNDYEKCGFDAVGRINDEFRDVQKGINGATRYVGYLQLGELNNGEIIDMEPFGDELCKSIYGCGVKGEHCECEPGYCNADPAGGSLYCYEDEAMKARIYMDKDDLSCDDNYSDKADNQIFM